MSRALLLLVLAARGAGAFLLDVRAGASRCLQEVLGKHDLVKAAYKLEPREGGVDGERSSFEIRVSGAAGGARGATAAAAARARHVDRRAQRSAHSPSTPPRVAARQRLPQHPAFRPSPSR
jgi:hypothetical protein